MKRIFDFFLALIGLFMSLPLWCIFGLTIWFEDRGPIFYFQERVGKDGKIFKSIKFRSMKPDAERGIGPVQAEENDPRVTRIGRFLRKTAMDELPQLINIFKGDMSFVGPRALRPVESEAGEPDRIRDVFSIPGFEKRVTVRPGLTGYAQVYTLRHLAREEKFKYDAWYVDNGFFCLDIKLMAMSFLRTFRAKWDV